MESNLLKGNIKRELIKLAYPLLLGNILQQLYNTVDALIIGAFLGTDAFSAVGVAGTVMNLLIFILNGFCIGLCALFAQLYGAGKYDLFRKEVFISTLLGSVLTVFLCAALLAVMRPLLTLMQTPAEIMPLVTVYLTIIIVGMPAAFFYNLLSGILRAVGNTRAATLFLFTADLLNVALDYLAVGVFSFGIAGAAAATVISQTVAAVCCLVYLKRNGKELICKRSDIGLDNKLINNSLSYGLSSALQQSSIYIGKIFVQGAVNTLGTAGIAAYTATMRIEGFANSFGDSGMQSVSVFVSQNHGAGNKDRVKKCLRDGVLLNFTFAVVISVIMFTTAHLGMLLFFKPSETIAIHYGEDYMKLISLFYFLCFIGNIFVGFFRGIGKIAVPVIGSTLQIAIRVIFSFLLVKNTGLAAVAIATGIGWFAVIVYQLISYIKLKSKN